MRTSSLFFIAITTLLFIALASMALADSGILTANFTSTVPDSAAPLVVQFNDTSTGSPTGWQWNFGDGSNAIDQNPVHAFQSAGTYNVALTVTNASSQTNTTASLIVVSAAPTATPTVTPTPTPTPTPTGTPTPTPTLTPTPTTTPSATPTSTPRPSPTPTTKPKATPTQKPKISVTPTPTLTPVPTIDITPTPEPTDYSVPINPIETVVITSTPVPTPARIVPLPVTPTPVPGKSHDYMPGLMAFGAFNLLAIIVGCCLYFLNFRK